MAASSLKYFGFAFIDTNIDDPSDDEQKTVYIDEVQGFTNTADVLVVAPNNDIRSRVSAMRKAKLKVYVHMSELFFERVGQSAPSGVQYALRPDYQARWDQFVAVNKIVRNSDDYAAMYLGEEPTWLGISAQELALAADYMKSTVPDVPILVVEASLAVEALVLPDSVDYVGFDHYFVSDPTTDRAYQRELSALKSAMSDSQQLVIIMDTHYIPSLHGEVGGIAFDEMVEVANRYYELAKSEENTVAIVGYSWPGGLDDDTMLGARSLNAEAQEVYRKMGHEIIDGQQR